MKRLIAILVCLSLMMVFPFETALAADTVTVIKKDNHYAKADKSYSFSLAYDANVTFYMNSDEGLFDWEIVNSANELVAMGTKSDFNSPGTGKIFETLKLKLSKGDYKFSVIPTDGGVDYEFYAKAALIKSKTISKSMATCTTYKAALGLGKGTWSTSDSNVVSISVKSGSTCTFRAKNKGNAVVTFQTSGGAKYTYKIKVYKKAGDPIRAGYLDVSTDVQPYLIFANTSSKTVVSYEFDAILYDIYGNEAKSVYNVLGSEVSLLCDEVIKPYRMLNYCWSTEFYNTTVQSMYIDSIKVTYKDGSTKTFSIKKYITTDNPSDGDYAKFSAMITE